MGWLQLTLATDRARAPLIETVLTLAEAQAVTLADAGDEQQLEPPPGTTPLWSQVLVTGLFPNDAEALARAQQAARSLADQIVGEPRFEHLEDRAWERAWLDDFAPQRFGRRLWVCPHGQAPDVADAVVVELDAGLAFGTGHHPTTALCLRWLDGADLAGKRIIDYGCGSGILAIAALRLGAAAAVAIDHDPQALEATRSNARDCGLTDCLTVCAPEEHPSPFGDVLLANILAGPLLSLAPAFADLLRPGGDLILSGLLSSQVGTVASAYRRWFDLDAPEAEEDWALIHGLRRSSCP
jgi:ribosomal protein L11 methyltransferase